MTKFVHFTLGWVCIALGLIGAVLPIMPTTIFIILAAYFFTKGSPRIRAWLMDHPLFGDPIRDWEERGAIPLNIKITAVLAMAASVLIAYFLGVPPKIVAVQGFVIFAVSAYVVTRPSA